MHGPRRDRSFLTAKTSILLAMLSVLLPVSIAVAGTDAELPRLRAAAEQGYVHEEIALADAYFNGRGVAQDLKSAAHWYERAAGSGDALAQNQIGYLYQAGMGVPADAKRAVHWYQLAASGGLTIAKVNLGVAYIWGVGVARNPRLGEQLFREAASGGCGVAAVYLGDMYYMGVGVSPDKAVGKEWYEKGVKLHSYLAEYRMAFILSQTDGHKKDVKRAADLFRASAAEGFVPSMHSFGLLIANHPELNGSQEEALSNLNRAADAGFWKSSVVLGVLARDGKLGTKDARAAYYHFQAAVDVGGAEAQSMLSFDLQRLSQKLSAQEIAELNTTAEAWAAKHHDSFELIYKGGENAPQFSAFALAPAVDGVHAGLLVPVPHSD